MSDSNYSPNTATCQTVILTYSQSGLLTHVTEDPSVGGTSSPGKPALAVFVLPGLFLYFPGRPSAISRFILGEHDQEGTKRENRAPGVGCTPSRLPQGEGRSRQNVDHHHF